MLRWEPEPEPEPDDGYATLTCAIAGLALLALLVWRAVEAWIGGRIP